MRPFAVAVLVLLLSGCVSSPQAPTQPAAPATIRPGTLNALTDADRTAIEAGVRAYLQDDGSATFRTMISTKSREGVVSVCGYVNAKANPGDKPYIGTLAAGSFIVSGMGTGNPEIIAVQSTCGRLGINI